MELEVQWRGSQPAPVGTLYQDRSGAVFFEYDKAWRTGPRELSPVYLPNSTSGAVSTPTPGFGPLHGLFQDVLPDWWGERLMRSHFESRGIPWSRVTTYSLASGFRAGRVNGKAADISRRDLIRLAEEHDIGNASATIGRVIDAVSRWMDHATARGIPRTTAFLVASQHRLSI